MTEYLKMVPQPSLWQKLELKYFSISELFEELLSWNSESKLIPLQMYYKHIFWCHFGYLQFLWIKRGPLKLALPLFWIRFQIHITINFPGITICSSIVFCLNWEIIMVEHWMDSHGSRCNTTVRIIFIYWAFWGKSWEIKFLTNKNKQKKLFQTFLLPN